MIIIRYKIFTDEIIEVLFVLTFVESEWDLSFIEF